MESSKLEHFFKSDGAGGLEEARSVIQANATDGALLRSAAMGGSLRAVKFFIEAKDRFDLTPEEKEKCTNKGAADEEGTTPLHLASEKGHTEIVEYLLSTGSLINVTDDDDITPLLYAAHEGHEDTVKVLLSLGADHTIVPYSSVRYVIDAAIKKGHLQVVELLLKAGSGSGNSLLIASETGNEGMVRLLQKHNVLFDYGKEKYKSPLHVAAEKGYLNIFQLLLEDSNANLCARDEQYRMPLHLAAEGGHIEIAQLILSQSVPVSATDEEGRTPLHNSAAKGDLEMARLLLSHGAEINANNYFEDHVDFISKRKLVYNEEEYDALKDKIRDNLRDPLHHAVQGGYLPMVQLLIEAGAQINGSVMTKFTPYDLAVEKRNTRVALFLQSLGALLHKSHLLLKSVENDQLLTAMCLVVLEADVNDFWNPPLLHIAVEMNHVDVAHFLLQKKVCVNACDSKGVRPLHIAVQMNHFDIVRLLLQKGATLNVRNRYGDMPLHIAVKGNLFDIVQLLLQKEANVNGMGHCMRTPLHLACMWGYENIARLLIKHGASVNATTWDGNTPLHLLKSFTYCGFLLEQGADPHLINKHKETVLHRNCSVNYIHEFLQYNLLIDARDVDGNTPLFNKCKFGQTNAAKLLIQHGASVNTRNKRGDTPLKLAIQNGHFDTAKVIFDVIYRDQDEEILLHAVCKTGELDVATFLLKQTFYVNLRDKYGNSPLHKVTEKPISFFDNYCYDRSGEYSRKEIAKSLIEKGAQVHQANVLGVTPLYNAVEWAGTEFIKLLLENGADPLYPTNSNETPLELAQARRKEDIIFILQNWSSKD